MRNRGPRSPESAPGSHRWSAWLAWVATPIVIAGTSLALLFNPWWVLPAQQRAGVAAITGFPAAEVARVTESIIGDVTIGPPDFLVTAGGETVLDASERGHMRDVFGVLRTFGAVVVLAAMALVGLGIRNRGRAWWWRAVGRSALATAAVGAGVGILFAAFFDAAWLAFHRVFFPEGNFTFDPRNERLTQLFPISFWTEAATTVFLVGIAMSLALWAGTRLVGSRLDASRN